VGDASIVATIINRGDTASASLALFFLALAFGADLSSVSSFDAGAAIFFEWTWGQLVPSAHFPSFFH
jgi:hypothetical protein